MFPHSAVGKPTRSKYQEYSIIKMPGMREHIIYIGTTFVVNKEAWKN